MLIKESQLYLLCSIICLLSFVISIIVVFKNKKKFSQFEYCVVISLSLLMLSKCIEYYEKYVFKSNNHH